MRCSKNYTGSTTISVYVFSLYVFQFGSNFIQVCKIGNGGKKFSRDRIRDSGRENIITSRVTLTWGAGDLLRPQSFPPPS